MRPRSAVATRLPLPDGRESADGGGSSRRLHGVAEAQVYFSGGEGREFVDKRIEDIMLVSSTSRNVVGRSPAESRPSRRQAGGTKIQTTSGLCRLAVFWRRFDTGGRGPFPPAWSSRRQRADSSGRLFGQFLKPPHGFASRTAFRSLPLKAKTPISPSRSCKRSLSFSAAPWSWGQSLAWIRKP